MVTTQAQRTLLHTKLVELMDQEAADILMDQLPPAGWDQMATKDDLINTEVRLLAALHTTVADTNVKLAETNAAMQAGFAEAARERAGIVKAQARQLYMMVAAMVATTTPIWVALFIRGGT